MQILPDFSNRADQALSALEGASSSYQSNQYSTSQSFGDLMNSLASGNSRSHSWEKSLSNSVRSVADHYTDSAAASSTAQDLDGDAAGLLVREEDFADLRDELRKYGLSEDDIAALEEKVSSPEGITWRELMNKVTSLATQSSGKTESLDVETKRLLTGFLDRLGFSQGEVKDIVADLDEDKLDVAWQKISAKVASLSPDKTITVSQDELRALAKAFNVPGTSDTALTAFFAGGGKLTLNVAGLQNLLLMLKQASAGPGQQALKDAKESLKSIQEKLQDAIGKAMERAERDELASNRETKTASQSKVLIKKAAEEHYGEAANRVSRPDGKESQSADSRHLFKEPVHEKAGDAPQQDNAKNVIGKAGSGKDTHGDKNAAAQDNGKGNAGSQVQEAKAAGAAADGDELAAAKKTADAATTRFSRERAEAAQAVQGKSQNAHSGNSDGKSSGGDSNARADSSWAAFWNKVARGEAASEKSSEFFSVVDRSQAEARASATAERTAQAFRREGSLPRETMRNLEQAFMRNLGEGQRQLTLRLDPPQMGRVAVLLTVKNNEVSATLRTEKHETGQMLAEQLQQLRHSLEQQGLKVQKLDVQTQLNNSNHQSWMGMDGHNMAREHSTRQQTLNAWKQMRGANDSETALAHDVQHGSVQEQISQGGIHLIA
ncbi:hypothetical protein DPQ33_00730 [Oceanidesulfovibrio indonesiensis]|uniref:Flagellar hook-length control protein-like C-terminal domain-containing protein n=1 Tax=Oceanidesulfovibrio indonesiensis TaxID=54767 RepID=A0A7M3MJ41_9BACT|nr:flagellar hook-length control protein FliK [Oceanidesulfovibrio indonesiensis]TVM19795.1 hypothetical protein DPQ33_00730 [Oceanidesulfovibrio indonesiensis]